MSDRRGRVDLAACLLLGAFVATCFAPELLGRKSFFFFDVSSLNIPARDWAFRQIRSGHFPEWCTHWYAGFPFIAESQAGVYYPPNYLFFLPFPSWYATTLAYTSHLWLAGVGAYFLFRRWASREGAWVGAAAFELGGRLLEHQIHAAIVETVAWLPLILVLLTRSVERGDRRALWWAALIAGVHTLAGSLQTVMISHLAAAVYLLALSGLDWRRLFRAMVGVIVVGVGSFALGAALLAPAMDLFAQSPRSGGGSAEWANFGAIFPIRWIQFLLPGAFGAPGYLTTWLDEPIYETGLYHGGLTILLAVVGGFAAGGNRRGAFVGVFMVFAGLSLAVGEAHLVGAGFRKLPVFSGIRIPARYLLLTGLGFCQLAAIGWEELVENRLGARRRLFWSGALCIAFALAALAWTYGGLLGPLPRGVNPAALNEFESHYQRQILEADVPRLLATLAASGSCLTIIRFPHWRWMAMILLLLDLWWTAQPKYPTTDPSVHSEPRVVAAIKELCAPDPARVYVRWSPMMARGMDLQVGGWRIGRDHYRRLSECLYYERGPFFDVGLFPNMGQLPLQPKRLADFRAAIHDEERLMRLLGVSLVLSPTAFHPDRVVYKGPAGVIERLPDVLPYALYVTGGEVRHHDEILDRIASASFDPSRNVVFEDLSVGLDVTRTARADARWNGPNQLIIDVDAPPALQGAVMVHEMYDRGWTAAVDGKSAPISRVNWLFMATPVQSGRHQIVLTYAPAAVRQGRWISGVSFLIWLVLAFVRLGKGRELPLERPPPRLRFLIAIFVTLFVVSAVVFHSRWTNAFPTFLGGQ